MFDQSELNDLVHDLCFSKEYAELLASHLQAKNFWRKGTQIIFYRSRDREFRKYICCLQQC